MTFPEIKAAVRALDDQGKKRGGNGSSTNGPSMSMNTKGLGRPTPPWELS
jgi:hypothetical protein